MQRDCCALKHTGGANQIHFLLSNNEDDNGGNDDDDDHCNSDDGDIKTTTKVSSLDLGDSP